MRTILLIISILFGGFIALVSAQETVSEETEALEPEESLREKLARADSFFRKGDIEEAIDIYREYLKSGKAGPGAYFSAVRMLLYSNHHIEAIETGFEGMKKYPEAPQTLTAVGLTCLKSGLVTEAQFFFTKALRAKNTYAYAYSGAARILNSVNSPEGVKFMAQGLSLKSMYPEFNLYLAQSLQSKKSIKYLEAYLKTQPEYDMITVKEVKSRQAMMEQEKTITRLQPEKPLKIYFRVISGLPILSVSVNGGDPVDCVVSSGASEMILDSAWVEKAGVKAPYTIEKLGKEYQAGVLKNISFSDTSFENVPYVTGDISSMFNVNSPGLTDEQKEKVKKLETVKGTISLRQLFDHLTVKLDYHKNEIAVGKSMDDLFLIPEDYSLLPLFKFGTDMSLASVALKPRATFILDTGALETTVDREYIRIHKIPLPGSGDEADAQKKTDIIDETAFQLGDYTFKVKNLPISEGGANASFHMPTRNGIIGNDILTFINPFILDYTNGRFYFNATRIENLKTVKPPTTGTKEKPTDKSE